MKGIKGEREMKKKMIDIRNGKIIAFALVAVLLLIGTVGMAVGEAKNPFVGNWEGVAWWVNPPGKEYPFGFDVWIEEGVIMCSDNYNKFRNGIFSDEGTRYKLQCPWYHSDPDKYGTYTFYIDKSAPDLMYGHEYTHGVDCKEYGYKDMRRQGSVETPTPTGSYWDFNEGSGDTAYDRSGNGNDGTRHGATWVDNGGCGNALSFDGDDYVDCGKDPSITDDATIEAWVNFAAAPTGHWTAFVSKDEGSGVNNKWVFGYMNGKTVFHVGDASADDFHVYSNEWTPILNQWYHLAVVKSGDTYTFYRDGAADGTDSATLAIPTINAHLEIGRAEGGGCFNGIMDEVRIYNYALSQSQIQADMRKCTPSTPTATGTPTISPTVTLRPTPTPAPIITKLKKCVGNEPYLYVGDKVMGKGKTVEIPIIMCNAKDLANMDLDWSYDASVLKLIDVTKGSLNKKAFFEWNKVSPGKLKIAFASTKGVSGSGSIAVMKFEVIGNTGAKSTITGTVDTASKTDGSTISVGVNPGEVTVGTSPIKGDCDGDNKLTSKDALTALRISVQKIPFDICYDYNGDGKVNSEDARDILKAIVLTGGK